MEREIRLRSDGVCSDSQDDERVEMSMLRVGFIGLGAMGLPMARNVMKAGFPLGVWARREEAAQALVSEGATWARSACDLARSADVVITIVTNSPDVEQVVTGDNGVLQGASRGLTVVDMSTISPTVTRRIHTACAERGVDFLDAPVSGGTQGAEAGTLTIMVGGEPEGFERVKPVLEAMGRKVVHVGPSGSGEVIKLVNNILVGVIAAATSEALVLGTKAGANLEAMAEVVGASTGASWQLANQFPLRAFSGTFKPGFMTDLLLKDLDLALDLGAEMETPLFLTGLAKQLYMEARAEGYGRDDYVSILRVLERIAGIEVRSA